MEIAVYQSVQLIPRLLVCEVITQYSYPFLHLCNIHCLGLSVYYSYGQSFFLCRFYHVPGASGLTIPEGYQCICIFGHLSITDYASSLSVSVPVSREPA